MLGQFNGFQLNAKVDLDQRLIQLALRILCAQCTLQLWELYFPIYNTLCYVEYQLPDAFLLKCEEAIRYGQYNLKEVRARYNRHLGACW